MTPDIPRLRKAVEFAEASAAAYGPDLEDIFATGGVDTAWYQGFYVALIREPTAEDVLSGQATVQSCGTAYCIAGYTVAQLPGYSEKLVPRAGPTCAVLKPYLNGRPIADLEIAELARRELGLTRGQADQLFDGGNSVEDVRRIAEEIAGEPL